jgi:hypothetical protein
VCKCVCVEAKESKIDPPGRAHIHKYLRLDIGGERPRRERKMRFEHADSAATVLFRFRKEASHVGFVMWGGEKGRGTGAEARVLLCIINGEKSNGFVHK